MFTVRLCNFKVANILKTGCNLRCFKPSWFNNKGLKYESSPMITATFGNSIHTVKSTHYGFHRRMHQKVLLETERDQANSVRLEQVQSDFHFETVSIRTQWDALRARNAANYCDHCANSRLIKRTPGMDMRWTVWWCSRYDNGDYVSLSVNSPM